MADNREVTVERAIHAIKAAADEIPAEEFISYSTILDVHLSHALSDFSPEDQCELLEALVQVLKSHEDLARDISWDLVIVLLPFLESPLAKTVDVAEAIITSAATNGNPREVFIKTLEALSLISWAHEPSDDEDDDEDDDEEDEAHHSGDEGDSVVPKDAKVNEEDAGKLNALAGAHGLKKFEVLTSALAKLHPRISTKFPSRFLSTELSTLLSTLVKAIEAVDRDTATAAVEQALNYVKTVNPKLSKGLKLRVGERPPLPPRISTVDTIAGADEEDDSPEAQLQARLVMSFLTHILEAYLVRTHRQSQKQPPDSHGHSHPEPDLGGSDGRGLEVGWASKYDLDVVRPKKSKVPGGRTLIDQEKAMRDAQTGVKGVVDEISWMCAKLGLQTDELLDLCQKSEDPADDEDDDDQSDVGAPSAASDVPLSKPGALCLLAHRLSSTSEDELPSLHIFPEHSSIMEGFFVYGPGQSQPPVVDAVLFLGALALQTNGLGYPPEEAEPFMMYLQNFAVISTNASSPQARFLAHHHVSRCLRAHPNEAIRLAYIRDTLEHCPFESLKAAVIGILKDEILHATSPSVDDDENASVPSTPASIFGTPLCLTGIFDDLFPALDSIFGDEESKAWETFKDIYPRLIAIVNLYMFLLLGNGMRDRLGVTDAKFGDNVEKRFLKPLRKWVDVFSEKRAAQEEEGGAMEIEIMKDAIARVTEVRKSVVD